MKSYVESILFLSPKPMTVSALVSVIKKVHPEVKKKTVEQALDDLTTEYNQDERGINLITNDGQYQFVTNPKNADLVKQYVKDESTGELTQPSLETLAIVAYRGPISKPHIEQIRGVNCSLILRNLLIRGLVQVDDTQVETVYSVTPDFLKYLGMTEVGKLPNYDKLHEVENLEEFLSNQEEKETA